MFEVYGLIRMQPPPNISSWIIQAQKYGLSHIAESLHSTKLEDYERLKRSNLPIFADFSCHVNNFDEQNKELCFFLDKYDQFIVRALPNTRNLPRRHKLGVKSFNECRQFLNEVIGKDDEEKYSVLMTENEEPKWVGAIIVRDEGALIEVGKSKNLNDVVHGHINPHLGRFAYHGFNHYRSMRYATRNFDAREVMWRALNFLRYDFISDSDLFPEISFRKGYFEFVLTEKTNKIKFLDYKVNEGYLV